MLYNFQAEIALIGLSEREFESRTSFSGVDAAFLQILHPLSASSKEITPNFEFLYELERFLRKRSKAPLPHDRATWREFATLARGLAARLRTTTRTNRRPPDAGEIRENIALLNSWADTLD